MIKRLASILPLLLFFLAISVKAQVLEKRNSVKLYFIGNHTPDALTDGFYTLQTPGFSYERKLNKNLGVGAKYSFWMNVDKARELPLNWGWHGIYMYGPMDTAAVGKIQSRREYSFIDLYGIYNFNIHSNHRISLKGGPSIAYGENTYLTNLQLSPWTGPAKDIIAAEFEYKKETYFGGVVELSYDYFFWQNRLSAGADVSSRFYNKDFPLHFNYGLHVGFNF